MANLRASRNLVDRRNGARTAGRSGRTPTVGFPAAAFSALGALGALAAFGALAIATAAGGAVAGAGVAIVAVILAHGLPGPTAGDFPVRRAFPGPQGPSAARARVREALHGDPVARPCAIPAIARTGLRAERSRPGAPGRPESVSPRRELAFRFSRRPRGPVR